MRFIGDIEIRSELRRTTHEGVFCMENYFGGSDLQKFNEIYLISITKKIFQAKFYRYFLNNSDIDNYTVKITIPENHETNKWIRSSWPMLYILLKKQHNERRYLRIYFEKYSLKYFSAAVTFLFNFYKKVVIDMSELPTAGCFPATWQPVG